MEVYIGEKITANAFIYVSTNLGIDFKEHSDNFRLDSDLRDSSTLRLSAMVKGFAERSSSSRACRFSRLIKKMQKNFS